MCIAYINGKKFAGEQDQSLFPGVGRVAGECPETSAQDVDGLVCRVSVLIRRWHSCPL